jgi:hypothetical protein
MHVSIFFICKRVRHLAMTATQHSHTNLKGVQVETQSSYSSSSVLHYHLTW